MLGNIKPDMGASASLESTKDGVVSVGFKNSYHFECFDSEGNLKWEETINNRVVNVGLDEILNQFYKGSAYTAAHYVGLTDGAPLSDVAADTMASHVGWLEVTGYTGNRQPLVLDAVSAQSVSNGTTKATFAITGTATVGGAFVNTAATGTLGILIGVATFSGGDKLVANGDILNVTVTLTAANV